MNQQAGKKTKKTRKPMNTKAKKVLKIVVSVVLVCGLLTAYIGTGMVRGGLLSYFQVPQKLLTGVTVTNNEDQSVKLTVGQYNYYYATAYNQIYSMVKMYGQYGLDLASMGYNVDFSKALDKQVKETKDDGTKVTWADYLDEQVLENIKKINVFYRAAVANNDNKEPEISEENQKTIDDEITQFKESADENGYTVDAYIRAAYGKGVNEKMVRAEMKKSLIASNYETKLNEEADSVEYTVDQAKEYFDKNSALLSSVDVQVFEAKDESTAKSMLEAVKQNNTEQGFADAASNAAETDYYKEAYKDLAKTVETNLMQKTAKAKYSLGDSGFEWLYSADRAAGDTAVYGNFVVRLMKPLYKSELPTVTVRHILIAPEVEEGSEAVKATDEQWAAAKSKADEVFNQWKANGGTEDAFSALTADNSDDSGSASSGGLIENAYPSQMVNEFNYWIFDTARKKGDAAIVRTDYGYHLIYFVSVNQTPYWQTVAVESLKDDAMGEKLDGTLQDYEVKVNWFGSRFFIDDKNLAS